MCYKTDILLEKIAKQIHNTPYLLNVIKARALLLAVVLKSLKYI